MPARLADLAVRFGCELRGDPDALVERVAPLQDAGAGLDLVPGQSALPAPPCRTPGPRRSCSTPRPPRTARSPRWWRAIPTPPTRGSRSSCTRRRPCRAGVIRAPSSRRAPKSTRRPGSGRTHSSRAARASAGASSIGPGSVAARGRRDRRRHAARRARHAVPRACASASAASCTRAAWSAQTASVTRPTSDGYVKVPQVGDGDHRQRRRDRQQFHDRPRRDRGHGDRGRRQDRQPGAGRPQRAHRRAHRDRGLRRHLGQHHDRQALHARRHGRRRRPPRDLRRRRGHRPDGRLQVDQQAGRLFRLALGGRGEALSPQCRAIQQARGTRAPRAPPRGRQRARAGGGDDDE